MGIEGEYTARTYDEAGLPVGSYKVAVSPLQFSGSGVTLVGSEQQAAPKNATVIPEVYRTIRTSPLTADVKQGDNPPFDFRLEPK